MFPAIFPIANETEMLALGARMGAFVSTRMMIFLNGELGAGKTTWVRGFLRGKGHVGSVLSPTFTLIETYEALKPPIYHADFYRLENPADLVAIGFWDYVQEEAILLIEWPSQIGEALPQPDWDCEIRRINEEQRVMTVMPKTAQGEQFLHLINQDTTG